MTNKWKMNSIQKKLIERYSAQKYLKKLMEKIKNRNIEHRIQKASDATTVSPPRTLKLCIALNAYYDQRGVGEVGLGCAIQRSWFHQ